MLYLGARARTFDKLSHLSCPTHPTHLSSSTSVSVTSQRSGAPAGLTGVHAFSSHVQLGVLQLKGWGREGS